MINPVGEGRDIKAILSCLPHRYPFLLVDRILTVDPKVRLTALKNVTVNEPFFQGHFPDMPVMPGVLMLEALAQAAALLIGLSYPEKLEKKIAMYAGVEKARFRRPVVPGDQLILEVTYLTHKLHIWKVTGKATVDGKTATEAVLTAALQERVGA